MKILKYKYYLLGKDNETDGRQDALSINDTSAMFAVADGVSNSFHPEIVARKLCEIFTTLDANGCELDDWGSFSNDILLPQIGDSWKEEVETLLSSLEGRLLRHEKYNYERWRMGASTFCGIRIDVDKEILKYYIIGDSTLFVHSSDNGIIEFNSNQKFLNESDIEITDYTNTTSAVTSSNELSGEWLSGEISIIGVKFIALMTDGMAKWYQNQIQLGNNPFINLWTIETKEEFMALADNERSVNNEMDDDLAIILISIEDKNSEIHKSCEESEIVNAYNEHKSDCHDGETEALDSTGDQEQVSTDADSEVFDISKGQESIHPDEVSGSVGLKMESEDVDAEDKSSINTTDIVYYNIEKDIIKEEIVEKTISNIDKGNTNNTLLSEKKEKEENNSDQPLQDEMGQNINDSQDFIDNKSMKGFIKVFKRFLGLLIELWKNCHIVYEK